MRMRSDFLGCQNLVYEYVLDGKELILRVTYPPDRPFEQILAELDFVKYLADKGASVSRPVPSVNGNLIERVPVGDWVFLAVSFVKGRGMRVPDNDYHYREGAPIEEYFRNWGRTLGKLHALAKDYEPPNPLVRRPMWVETRSGDHVRARVPEAFPIVRRRLEAMISESRKLPQDKDSYGLIHGDFNDGNFTVDYSNGDITVFDFDDACYNWFMYDLACAWEAGLGRTMFEPDVEKRREFMKRYFEQAMAGYRLENDIEPQWLDRLSFFIKMVEMDSALSYFRYYSWNTLSQEEMSKLRYIVHCIEKETPYFGFFDPIYSAKKPFTI